MFEELGLDGWTPVQASLLFGLALGVAFGALAQYSRFCLRRALVGDTTDRRAAAAVWLLALATAITGTQIIAALGYIDVSGHRFVQSGITAPAILLGGLLFGAGMVIARGCASRLTVLAGSGNLRALVAILIFAVIAHATLKGALAPLRVSIASYSVDLPFAQLPASPWIWAALATAAAVFAASRAKARPGHLAAGILIGALVPLGWLGTGFVLFDEFDPITLESLAFTSAATEGLFWAIAGTAITPAFGVGFLGGVLAGSALSALARREFAWTGFTADLQAPRYLWGGALMGMGGVLAGGCTVGAGLTGTSTLGISAVLALGAIITGALATRALTGRSAAALAA